MTAPRVAMISFHTCPVLAPGAGKVGGMNVYVRELSRHLGAMGIGVDIFTRRHPDQDTDVVTVGHNVRVIHLDGGPKDTELENLYPYIYPFTQSICRFQESEGTEYSLIHSHYWMSALAGRYLARKNTVRHVVTFHTLAELKRRARAGEGEPLFRTRIEGDLMKSADQIIASSLHEKDAMVQLYGAPSGRIEAVHCGVDLSLFKPLDMTEARHRLGLNGEKVMLYVGRIEPLKGVEFLLRITAIMDGDDPLKVLIVGGDPTQEQEVQRLAALSEEMGVADVVEFVGRVNQDQLSTYFSAADVCVVPSYYESFGLVALESMACGTPVIASRVGGLPAVVKHGQNGYLLPWRCPERYADTLTMVMQNKGLRKSMSHAALEMAGTMGWDKVAVKVADIYQSLLRGAVT